jgi:hypothetical protein
VRNDLNTDDRLEDLEGEDDAMRTGRNFVPDTIEGDIRAQQGRPIDN